MDEEEDVFHIAKAHTFEDFFHGHRSCQHPRLPLNDTLHKLLDMVGELVMGGDELGILIEAFDVIDSRADGEDGGEEEGQLLGTHGLHLKGVIHRGDVKYCARLARKDPCLFGQLDVFHSIPCNHQEF